MTDPVRAFMAIELPPDVKVALTDLVEELDRANLRGVRLVRPEGIHLTLKFLGNVPRARLESIEAAVRRVAEDRPAFALDLGGPGVFPNRNAPRVLWVGVDGELAPLESLHRGIEDALAELGFERDKRRFGPHLTVARLRDGASQADRRSAAQSLFSVRLRTGLPIEVQSISLMRSILSPDGAVYERLAAMPLARQGRRINH